MPPAIKTENNQLCELNYEWVLFTLFHHRATKTQRFLKMDETKLNQLSGVVLDATLEVHKNLDPGPLESVLI